MPENTEESVGGIIYEASIYGFKDQGVWGFEDGKFIIVGSYNQRAESLSLAEIVLDLDFWRAISRARNWGESNRCGQCRSIVKEEDVTPYWQKIMHDMVDHIIQGGDAVSFLKELSNK